MGKNRYVNITVLDADKIKTMGDSKWEPAMADGYFIYKYEIYRRQIDQWPAWTPSKKRRPSRPGKSKAKAKAITDRFTDTTENLVRFLASPDADKLFYTKEHMDDGYAVLERVK